MRDALPSRAGRRRPAAGFTLLEVLLALFVVGTAAVLLGQGYTQNLRAIGENRVDTTLAFLAQWKMSEVVAGVISPDLDAEGSFEEDGYPDYEWRITSAETETLGLNEVSVTARRVTAQTTREFTLHRLVYTPDDVLEIGL